MKIKNFIQIGASIIVLTASQYLLNSPLGLNSVWVDGLLWTIGVLISGSFLKALVPRFSHIGVLFLILGWLIAGVGLTETIVVVLWISSAWIVGAVLLRWSRPNSANCAVSLTEGVLLGMVIWLTVWGIMLHFPMNYPGLYLGLCLLPFLWLLSMPAEIFTDLRLRVSALNVWMESIPFWAWLAGLALLGWTLRWSSFPSLAYDDHAHHLRLWTDLLTERRALFDVNAQIWSVAPFASNLLHSGLSLMAGADIRSAMNLFLAIMLLALFIRILHRLNSPVWLQWMLMVLMASTPMLGNLLLSLQTELLLSLMGLAGLRLVIDAQGGWRGQNVIGVLACAAICAAIKLPGAVLGTILLLSLALRWWSLHSVVSQQYEPLRWPALTLLIPLTFVAFHSYALAWWITGNPVFPLYNAIFLSELYPPVNFSDTRFIHGFSLNSYIRAFFQTSKFFESTNYTAGWQYLLMLPISLVALLRTGTPFGLRLASLILMGFGLVMFSATQYWRYMFPVMPIAGIVLSALFIGSKCYWRAAFFTLTIFCIVLNIVFFPGVSWMMRSPAQIAYTNEGKKHLTRLYAPVVLLTKEVNRKYRGSRVLYPPNFPYGATLHGSPLYVNWYAPSRQARFSGLKDAHTLASFLSEEKVDFVILNMNDIHAFGTPSALLREHLAKYGIVKGQTGSFILHRLSDAPTIYRNVFDLQNEMLKKPEHSQLLLPGSIESFTATPQPKALAVLPTHQASQARYSVRLSCTSEDGFFIAQINWDVGEPYYRLIKCQAESLSFVETVSIPQGAQQGVLFITVRNRVSAQIEDLRVDVH